MRQDGVKKAAAAKGGAAKEATTKAAVAVRTILYTAKMQCAVRTLIADVDRLQHGP